MSTELINGMELGVKMTDPVILANAVPRYSGDGLIMAGLAWLTRVHQEGQWIDSDLPGDGSRLWVTACTLARLSELPSEYISPALRQQIEMALNRLQARAVAGSGWSCTESGKPDAFTTAWAILALRCHRRAVPRAAIEFLLRCREPNGGFTAYPYQALPEEHSEGASAEITVTALRALSMCDRAGGDFVTAHLRNDLSSTPLGNSSRFYICSEILDWGSGLAPWPLLNQVSQSAIQFDLGRPYEQALLLRILSRLRNQRAWLAASALQKMQRPDGSWASSPVAAQEKSNGAGLTAVSDAHATVLSTITALAALSVHESGLGCSDSARRKPGALL